MFYLSTKLYKKHMVNTYITRLMDSLNITHGLKLPNH